MNFVSLRCRLVRDPNSVDRNLWYFYCFIFGCWKIKLKENIFLLLIHRICKYCRCGKDIVKRGNLARGSVSGIGVHG